MNFDKTKAMRNAEKYLSQGKIRAAIGEYEQVVKNDARDFGTLNMLGDLYSKNSDATSAISCYIAVADHYGNQGFFQKAIAVYNKISRLDPDSVQVWQKLGELHKQKGSLGEAKFHFQKVADNLEKSGRKMDALAVWKEIAQLDPTNPDAYLSLADSYLSENQPDEAFDAFTEGGRRLSAKGRHDEALVSIERALTIRKDDPAALSAYLTAKKAIGAAGEAAARFTELLLEFPHSREILSLQVDAFVAAGQISDAEKAVVKLVELEPAHFPRLLELGRIYIGSGEFNAAARVLSMSSEHLLVGGQAVEFNDLVSAVLKEDADNLEGLRLQARYCSWQRDEEALCSALERLASAAERASSFEDERYALQQLCSLRPLDAGIADRLRVLNAEHGFETVEEAENLFDKRFLKRSDSQLVQNHEEYTAPGEAPPVNFEFTVDATALCPDEIAEPDIATGFSVVENEPAADEVPADPQLEANSPPIDADAGQLGKEIESVRFYIENGYLELAEKAAFELKNGYGERPEIIEVLSEIRSLTALFNGEDDPAEAAAETAGQPVPEAEEEAALPAADAGSHEDLAEAGPTDAGFDLSELRRELGLDESGLPNDADFETFFNTGTAYKEMGLFEEAVKEFQAAAGSVAPTDGTRRFFACANLLGFCFIELEMPSSALKWFERALKAGDLTSEEKKGIWYEIALAYELDSDMESAERFFELVYAEDANFRDVSEKLKSVSVNR